MTGIMNRSSAGLRFVVRSHDFGDFSVAEF